MMAPLTAAQLPNALHAKVPSTNAVFRQSIGKSVWDRRLSHVHASISDRNSTEGALTARAGQSIKTQAAAAVAPPAAGDLSAEETNAWLASMPMLQQLSPPVHASRLTDDNTVFEEQHRIRGYEVGPDRQATILTIANLLQECGSNHVVSLWGRTDHGFGACPEMVDNKQSFAVTRLQIQMDTYPTWGDVVQLSSWFQEDTRLSAAREWRLTDARTGNEFGRATSTWVVVNMQTRRLSKVPPTMRVVMERFTPIPARHAVTPAETKQKIPDVTEPFDIVGPVQVARRSDMDMNGHINNVTYLAWTLETVPEDVFSRGKLRQIELDYKHECQAGDTVESGAMYIPADEVTYTAAGRNVVQFLHILRRCDQHKCTELVRARTTWVLD